MDQWITYQIIILYLNVEIRIPRLVSNDEMAFVLEREISILTWLYVLCITSKQYQETKKLVVDLDFSTLDITTPVFFWNSIILYQVNNTVNPLLLLYLYYTYTACDSAGLHFLWVFVVGFLFSIALLCRFFIVG